MAAVCPAFSATAAAVGSGSRPETAPALAAHQERAYERACDIMDRFGGVIIAPGRHGYFFGSSPSGHISE